MNRDKEAIFHKIDKVRLTTDISRTNLLEKAGFSGEMLEKTLSSYDYYLTGLLAHEPKILKKMAEIVGLNLGEFVDELNQSKQTKNISLFIEYLVDTKLKILRVLEGPRYVSDEEKRDLSNQLGILQEVIYHLPKEEYRAFEAKYKETKEYTYWD